MEEVAKSETDVSIWRCFAVRAGEKRAVEVERGEIPNLLKEEDTLLWIDIEAAGKEDVAWLGEVFDFHELTLTDILNNAVRPKQETFDHFLFTVFGAINLNPGQDALDTINLNIFLTEQYIVSVHCKPLKTTRGVINALMKGRNWLARGTDHMYYRLLDGVINRYLDIMDEMEVNFDEIERRVFSTTDKTIEEAIFREKRRIAFLKRSVGPQRDALRELVYGSVPQFDSETQTLLRDVLDHILRINDALESYRELASGLMDSYMSQISNRMNEVMKLMSIIATVMLPLSFLTGIFGMNFEAIPGINLKYGFWFLCLAMVILVIGLIWFFRRKRII